MEVRLKRIENNILFVDSPKMRNTKLNGGQIVRNGKLNRGRREL